MYYWPTNRLWGLGNAVLLTEGFAFCGAAGLNLFVGHLGQPLSSLDSIIWSIFLFGEWVRYMEWVLS
jgi:hypothetical protein